MTTTPAARTRASITTADAAFVTDLIGTIQSESGGLTYLTVCAHDEGQPPSIMAVIDDPVRRAIIAEVLELRGAAVYGEGEDRRESFSGDVEGHALTIFGRLPEPVAEVAS